MPALREIQSAMAAAIRGGPDKVPLSAFLGDQRRVTLGFAVHANTISHGRLVALEDTFPKTMAHMGEGAFNSASRAFLDAGKASCEHLSDIGREFPDWLRQGGVPDAAIFADFEWAWLESYRAAEAAALTRNDIATLDETSLLALEICHHPAARLVSASPELAEALELATQTDAVVLTRPEASVQVMAVEAVASAAFTIAGVRSTIGELLAELADEHDEQAILPALLSLIDAGALVVP